MFSASLSIATQLVGVAFLMTGSSYLWLCGFSSRKEYRNPRLIGDRSLHTVYQRDQESGLDYAMDRYYGNTSGRFESPDTGAPRWKIPTTLNRYLYTADDPINYTDPTGKIMAEEGPLLEGSGGGSFPCSGIGFLSTIECIAEAVAAAIRNHPERNAECPLVGASGNYTTNPNSPWPVHDIWEPNTAAALGQAIEAMNSLGIIPQINEGFRTRAEQIRVNSGASGRNPSAAPGQSWHEIGTAADIQLHRGADGQWDATSQTIIDLMTKAGFTWGGTFTPKDNIHFQLGGAHTVSTPNGPIIRSGAPPPGQVAACEREHPNGR
jgi:RHS repeat-associated protein